jgi:hypothetical protein
MKKFRVGHDTFNCKTPVPPFSVSASLDTSVLAIAEKDERQRDK